MTTPPPAHACPACGGRLVRRYVRVFGSADRDDVEPAYSCTSCTFDTA